MPRSLSLLSVIILLLTAACSDRAVLRSLDHAESIMESHPDSALLILELIDPTTFHSERNAARYALLFSQALDKNYVDLTDDSLISIAENFYERKDYLRPLMLSYFYHGRILENDRDLPQSLRLYTKSLECARLLGDDFWSGRVASQIAGLYYDTNHNTDFLHYSRIAYDHFMKTGRQTFINYALFDLARATFLAEEYDRAILLCEELSDSALKYHDVDLVGASEALKAKAFYLKKDYHNAISVYENLIDEDLMNYERYAILGLCYLAINEEDKIKEIPMPTDSVCSQEIDALHLMYELAERTKESEKAQDIYGRIALMNDSVLSLSLDQNFGQVLSELYSQEREVRNLEQKSHRFLLMLILLLIIIIVLVSLFYHKRQSEVIDRKIAMASNLEEILSVKENDLNVAHATIRKLFTDKYEFISTLFDFYYSNSANKSLKRKISEEIDKIIEDFSNNEEKILKLEESVDQTCDNLISLIKKDLPGMKQADRLLFLYSVLGFSHNAIALILKEEKMTSVYNRKRRLKDKIKTLDPARAELYLTYFN